MFASGYELLVTRANIGDGIFYIIFDGIWNISQKMKLANHRRQ